MSDSGAEPTSDVNHDRASGDNADGADVAGGADDTDGADVADGADGASPDRDADSSTAATGAERHTALSAWGTLLAGVAAVLTLFTACTTTYVAYVTYKDGRQQDEEKQAQQEADFAQRVLASGTGKNGGANITVENRNLLPVGGLRLRVWATIYKKENCKAAKDTLKCILDYMRSREVDDVEIGPVVVPACTQLTFSMKATLSGDDGWAPRDYSGWVPIAADFTDRRGVNWWSPVDGIFVRGNSKRFMTSDSLRKISKDAHLGKRHLLTAVTTSKQAKNCR
ncbi:hypothetical protein ABT116_10430 [Streptomyces sp. NPDC002130]|uniref:hypothetical protein n=1 Tax=Streptomyces sp. NPDC002130 TaxID=3155568 RepID=UPI00331C9ACA